MRFNIRLFLVCIIMGIFPIIGGLEEYTLSKGASKVPVKTSVAGLEAQQKPTDKHLALGPHLAVYDGLVYYSDTDRTKAPGNSTKVDYYYYPIISESHPYINQVSQVVAKYGDADRVPEKE